MAFLQNQFPCPPMLELEEPKGPRGEDRVLDGPASGGEEVIYVDIRHWPISGEIRLTRNPLLRRGESSTGIQTHKEAHPPRTIHVQ